MFAAFLSIAVMAFGPAPCGHVQIFVHQLPAAVLGQAAAETCTIELDPEALHSGRAFACTVVVHEYGHITGHKHSADPRNVMYPYIERLYWRCKNRWPPRYLRLSWTERNLRVHPDTIRTVPFEPIREAL